MSSPIVFLDIDGVLNSRQWLTRERVDDPFRPYDDELDPDAIRRLNRLCHETGARIVISSTWRLGYHDCESLLLGFAKHRMTAPIVGMTPDLCGRPRGEEIAAWIGDNSPDSPFVILDDDSDMGELAIRLIKTSFETGLTDADVERAICLLTETT